MRKLKRSNKLSEHSVDAYASCVCVAASCVCSCGCSCSCSKDVLKDTNYVRDSNSSSSSSSLHSRDLIHGIDSGRA